MSFCVSVPERGRSSGTVGSTGAHGRSETCDLEPGSPALEPHGQPVLSEKMYPTSQAKKDQGGQEVRPLDL